MKKLKKSFLLTLAAVLILLLAACGNKNQTEIPEAVQKKCDQIIADLTGTGADAAGGWTRQDSTELTDAEEEVFDNAVAAQKEAAEDTASASVLETAVYTPLALEATQVVAGLNYCFLCEVTVNGETGYQLIYVYRDTAGIAEITDTMTLDS